MNLCNRVVSDLSRCSLNIWLFYCLNHLLVHLFIRWIVAIFISRSSGYRGSKTARILVIKEFKF